MSEPAFEQAPIRPVLSSEQAAKPKISRRPAKFVKVNASAEILPMADVKIELIAAQLPEQPAQPTSRPWQEDARFGIALMAAIVIINLLVVLSLSQPEATQMVVQKNIIPESTGTNSVNVLDDRAVEQ